MVEEVTIEITKVDNGYILKEVWYGGKTKIFANIEQVINYIKEVLEWR